MAERILINRGTEPFYATVFERNDEYLHSPWRRNTKSTIVIPGTEEEIYYGNYENPYLNGITVESLDGFPIYQYKLFVREPGDVVDDISKVSIHFCYTSGIRSE